MTTRRGQEGYLFRLEDVKAFEKMLLALAPPSDDPMERVHAEVAMIDVLHTFSAWVKTIVNKDRML